MSETKDTNPKDAVGIAKVPASTVPREVIAEVGLAMMEGALKYGRHNYRDAGVRASVYYDACTRHLDAFYEGQDIDPDSGLSHLVKAIACLVVLRDSQFRDNWVDDRPPKLPDNWQADLNAKAAALLEKYPNPVPAHIEKKPASGGPVTMPDGQPFPLIGPFVGTVSVQDQSGLLQSINRMEPIGTVVDGVISWTPDNAVSIISSNHPTEMHRLDEQWTRQYEWFDGERPYRWFRNGPYNGGTTGWYFLNEGTWYWSCENDGENLGAGKYYTRPADASL